MSFSPSLALALAVTIGIAPHAARAWGGEGHEVVGLVAERFLLPNVRTTVAAMLAADTDNVLTAHDIEQEANWADKLRDEDVGGEKLRTRDWHFVDIEVGSPDLDTACFGHPRLEPDVEASRGPAEDCIVDKVNQFEAELRNPAVSAPERLVALKFLIHFVGDLHQPLHAADEKDRGGNAKRVRLPDGHRSNLHAFWDSAAVMGIGTDPQAVAREIEASITPQQAQGWQTGTPATWAMETFGVARDDAYGRLPRSDGSGTFDLSDDYVRMARRDAELQLGKAGVRLASILNETLGPSSRGVALVPTPSSQRVISDSRMQNDRASCNGDQVVWVNLRSGVYHLPGDKYFGTTKSGAFVCEKNAIADGDRAARGSW